MIGAVANLLRADTEFMAGLDGGLYDSAAGVDEVSRQTTPTAFDVNSRLLPCGLLRSGVMTTERIVSRGARLTMRLFLYELGGRSVIEPKRRRAFTLLHEKTVALGEGEGTCYEIVHLDDDVGGEDDALKCKLIICRFQAALMR